MIDLLLKTAPQLLLILVLLALSGYVSAMETALFSLSPHELARHKQSKSRVSRLIIDLRQRPRTLLSTILLTSTLINMFLFSTITITVGNWSAGNPLFASIGAAIGFIFVLIFADIGPKLAAFALADQLAPLVAPPLRFLEIFTSPARWLLERPIIEPLTRLFGVLPASSDSINTGELQELLGISRAEGLIDDRENFLLHQVMSLAPTRVSDLMVPRVDMEAFEIDANPDQLADLIKTSRLAKIPVYKSDIDHIQGIIDAKEFLLNRDLPISELLRPAQFIPEQAGVDSLLAHFRRKNTQVLLVVDEYGGLAGLVTVEDLAEAIIGEMGGARDADDFPPVERLSDTVYLIDGGLDVHDFSRAFDLPVEDSRITTIGGHIALRLDRVPRRDDRVDIGSARLEVVSIRKRRVLRARLTLDRPPRPNTALAILLESTREYPDAAKPAGDSD